MSDILVRDKKTGRFVKVDKEQTRKVTLFCVGIGVVIGAIVVTVVFGL